MPGIIESRKNSKVRKMAERFNLEEARKKKEEPEQAKSWNDVPVVIDTEYIASLLKVSTTIVSKWCREGKLKGRKEAGKWLVNKDNFIEFINASTVVDYITQSKTGQAV